MSDTFNSGIPTSTLPQTSSPVSESIRQQFPIQDVILRTLTTELAALKQTAQIEALIKQVQLLQSLPLPASKPEITAKPQLEVLPVLPQTPAQTSTQPTPQQQAQQTAKERFYQVILSTPLGDIKLEIPSKIPLEVGQKLALELRAGTPPVLSKLGLLNDASVKLNPAQMSQPLPPVKTGSMTPVVMPNVTPLAGTKPLQVGSILEAFLLPTLKPTPQAAGQTPEQLQTLGQKNGINQSLLENLKQNGFILQNPSALKSTGIAVPSEKIMIKIVHFLMEQTKGITTSNTPNAAGNTIGNNNTITKPQASGFIPASAPQTKVDLSGVHINTQKQLNANSPVMTGTVVGKTAQNAPILMTDIGQLFILSNTNLKEGSKVTFQMMAPESSSPALKPSVLPPPVPSNIAFDKWFAMDDLLTAFSAVDADPLSLPQLQNILPSVSKQLPTLLLFFLAAVKTGDSAPASLWMGQQLQQNLKMQGKQSLIDQLDGDFRVISKTVKEQKSGLEFRSTIIPFHHDEQIQPLQMLVRHQNPQQQQNDKQNNTPDKEVKPRNVRFLINLNLSRLGKTQIDGYLKNQNMDMILRLEKRMPETSVNAIINRYGEVLETLGLKGKISFHDNKDWVHFDSMPDEDLQLKI